MNQRTIFLLIALALGSLGVAPAQDGWYFIGGYQATHMQNGTALNRFLYVVNQMPATTGRVDLLGQMRGVVLGYGGSGEIGGIDMIWDRKKADLGTYEDASRGRAESMRILNNSFRMMPYLNIIPGDAVQVSLGLSLDIATFKTKRYQENTGRWVLEPGGFLGGFNPVVNSSVFMHFTLRPRPIGLRITPYAQLPWYRDRFDASTFADEFIGPIYGEMWSDQLQYLANVGIMASVLVFLGE